MNQHYNREHSHKRLRQRFLAVMRARARVRACVHMLNCKLAEMLFIISTSHLNLECTLQLCKTDRAVFFIIFCFDFSGYF